MWIEPELRRLLGTGEGRALGMTVREALGGPWASHWVLLIAFMPPSTLLVLLRETATPFPEWWWPLVSALAQHVVAAVVVVFGIVIARTVHTIIPIATVLSIWSLGAAMRGVVGGTLAQEFAGIDPEYAFRMAVWVVVSLIWVPALVYSVAQFERRRFIVGALDLAAFELEREMPRADATSAGVQQQLRQAIAESLTPALHDLEASLEASRPSLDRSAVVELSLRLSQLHDDAADLLDSTRTPGAPPPPSMASLRRALDVPLRRPWLTALLVACATMSLIVFDAWRLFGPLAAIEIVVSTAAAALAIGAVPAVLARTKPEVLTEHGQRTTGIGILLGIFFATLLMLNSTIDPITWHGLLIVPLLAIGLAAASATFVATIVLADANLEAEARLARLKHALISLRSTTNDSSRASELGSLSSCTARCRAASPRASWR